MMTNELLFSYLQVLPLPIGPQWFPSESLLENTTVGTFIFEWMLVTQATESLR
jgi:hypothetical protein